MTIYEGLIAIAFVFAIYLFFKKTNLINMNDGHKPADWDD
jgi:hypothetical protein